MTEELKTKLFEKAFQLESLAAVRTYDHRDYAEQANGAYAMLIVLGLDKEYIKWTIDKGWTL